MSSSLTNYNQFIEGILFYQEGNCVTIEIICLKEIGAENIFSYISQISKKTNHVDIEISPQLDNSQDNHTPNKIIQGPHDFNSNSLTLKQFLETFDRKEP